jgi:hypothetical protein
LDAEQLGEVSVEAAEEVISTATENFRASPNYPSETLIRQFIKLRCVNLKYSRGVLFSNAFCSKTSVQTFFQTFQSIANTPDISKLCYLLVHFWFQTFQSFANTSHVSEVANISNLCVSNKRGTEKQMKLGGV